MKEKQKKKKDLTVIVVNPKTKKEYEKMIDDLNVVFKKRYSRKTEGYCYEN